MYPLAQTGSFCRNCDGFHRERTRFSTVQPLRSNLWPLISPACRLFRPLLPLIARNKPAKLQTSHLLAFRDTGSWTPKMTPIWPPKMPSETSKISPSNPSQPNPRKMPPRTLKNNAEKPVCKKNGCSLLNCDFARGVHRSGNFHREHKNLFPMENAKMSENGPVFEEITKNTQI